MLTLSLGLVACAQQPRDTAAAPSPTISDNLSKEVEKQGDPPASDSTEASASTIPDTPSDSAPEHPLTTTRPGLWDSLEQQLTPPDTPTAEADSPSDLWHRIRAGFALPHYDHPKVQAEARAYATSQEHVDTVTQRATPYMYYVVQELEKRGMPTEIALVPIIESAYSPGAVSASGAAGIWQFIPSTGRHMGLTRNFWYDGRRDVIASTAAALTYLQRLNTEFDGDWLITLAAYNAGEGRLRRAIQKNQRAGRPADFWSLDLPQETATYVPRLLGIAALVNHPEEFGITLASIPNAPYLASVDVDNQINLNVAAQIAGMSRDELRRLNPGLLRGITDPKGTTTLLLPADKAEKFSRRLASIDPGTLQSHSLAKPQASKQSAPKQASGVTAPGQQKKYVVRQGDTLGAIARDFSISLAQLERWNADQLNGKYLTPGITLKIYPPAKAGS
ncbi:MAG: transglycosylase SLT domain-containing protein [Gammaproteobacteria bacterium]|nr:transglycosylase SLT domain-containing protein [Gammaproteobacteria bacterium]